MDSKLRVFMHYIDLAHQIESREPIAQLDATERFLLEILVKHWVQGQPMTVTTAMSLTTLGSPATVHRKLTRLRKLEMIQAQHDPSDNRIKYLLPSKRATDYFTTMGQAMLDAAAQL